MKNCNHNYINLIYKHKIPNTNSTLVLEEPICTVCGEEIDSIIVGDESILKALEELETINIERL